MSRDQFRSRRLKGAGQLVNVREAHVPLAPFNAANVGAVKTCSVSEILLRQTKLLATSANCLAEGDEFRLSHAPYPRRMMTMRRQSWSSIS